MRNFMGLLVLIVMGLMVGCSFYAQTEYEVTYLVTSSVPCSIAYLDEKLNYISIDNIMVFEKKIRMTIKADRNGELTPDFIIKERYCLGSISIIIDDVGISKCFNSSCCCEESLMYNRVVRI
jgi:hypothetical protein